MPEREGYYSGRNAIAGQPRKTDVPKFPAKTGKEMPAAAKAAPRPPFHRKDSKGRGR